MNKIECPRCFGKKNLNEADIKRIYRISNWDTMPCLFCEKQGFVDSNKTDIVSVDKVNLAKINAIADVPNVFYEKTFMLLHKKIPNHEILAELGKDGIKKELAQKILNKSRNAINDHDGVLVRKIAAVFFMFGFGLLALGFLIYWSEIPLKSRRFDPMMLSFFLGGSFIIVAFFFAFQDRRP
jgi:hypothetical protein